MGEVRFPRNAAIATTLVRLRGDLRHYSAGIAGLLLASGCALPIPRNGGTDPAAGDVPVVRLTLSNPSPQVGEEVILRCEVVTGGSLGTTFAFQPDEGRLFVDRATGSASFIVEGSDIGVAFSFTCSATDDTGTSEPSNEQVIIPT